MDKELRKLERDFAANSSLDVAEKIVRHKLKAHQLHTLIEIDKRSLVDFNNWITITGPYYKMFAFQLPNGILLRTSMSNESVLFVPGIKLV